MRVSPHKFLAVVIAVSIPVVVFWRPPELPEPVDERRSEPGAGAVGEALPEIAFLRRFAKEFVAREVVAGQRSALDAAVLFRELDRLAPTPDDILPPPVGAIPIADEERYRRQVISWVSAVLPEEPRDLGDATLAPSRRRSRKRRSNPASSGYPMRPRSSLCTGFWRESKVS